MTATTPHFLRRALVGIALVWLCTALWGCPELPPPPTTQVCVTNACGSCETLTKSPGDACGDCDSGQLVCNEAGGLECQTNPAPCDDGLFCNGAERCDPDSPNASPSGCVSEVLAELDDEDDCTIDRCDEETDTVTHDREPGCDCVVEEHLTDTDNCGCEGPCDQEGLERCVEGACACDPDLHTEDDEDCGCEGPCAEGLSCVEGACLWPCQRDGCPTLDARCEQDTLVSNSDEGVCDSESGECDHTESEVRTDCLQAGMICQDGACLDLCEGVDCARPQDFCDDSLALTYTGGGGECDIATGLCAPPIVEDRQDCAALSQICQDGACVDLCEDITCDESPFCEGETLVTPSEPGVCDFRVGGCDFEQTARTDCRQAGARCLDGQCVCQPEEHLDDIANCGCEGPCEPDSQRCLEGECGCDPLLHRQDSADCNCEGPCQEGDRCEAGQCSCDPAAHQEDVNDCGCAGACLDGQGCLEGLCRWPCELDGCPPPSDICEGNVLVTVEGEGLCSRETGLCDHTQNEERSDCEESARVCIGAACVDLCQDVDCSLPEDICEGEVSVNHSGGEQGCDFLTGLCAPPIIEDRTDCEALNNACVDGQCIDLCTDVECPSEAVCEGNSVVFFLEEGACERTSGQCRYPQNSVIRENCSFLGEVCDEGRCIAAHCLNDVTDGDETDLNCGGSCDSCPLGGTCQEIQDCQDQPCTNGVCAPQGFALVPAGRFTMGSSINEVGRDSASERSHEVTLSRSFLIMATEVTQEQFQDLMSHNPSFFSSGGLGADCGLDCPVESINFWEANIFANRMSAAQGLPECVTLNGCNGIVPGFGTVCSSITINAPNGNIHECTGYRLPTEAEWEFATRAGTATAIWNGALNVTDSCDNPDSNLARSAWYCANAQDTSHPVGEKLPNSFGLRDVHGNVMEWTIDRFINEYQFLSPTDPVNLDTGSGRTARGGFWASLPKDCRSARRLSIPPDSAEPTIGFRLVRTIPQD